MDKEYQLLEAIDKNKNITQREISKKTNLSLGSVNILLNKMAHDGLIKIKQIPLNRVAYILTPKGMTEKVNKTYSYIKAHYSYINETKEKMKECLINIKNEYNSVKILCENDEFGELLKAAAAEITGFDFKKDINDLTLGCTIITLNCEKANILREKGYKVINLLELI